MVPRTAMKRTCTKHIKVGNSFFIRAFGKPFNTQGQASQLTYDVLPALSTQGTRGLSELPYHASTAKRIKKAPR